MSDFKMNRISPLIALFVTAIALSSNLHTFAEDKVRVAVTLASDHSARTRVGDIVTISGQLAPSPIPLGPPPALIWVGVTVQHPDGSYEYEGDIWITDGSIEERTFEIPILVRQQGYIRARVYYGGNLYYQNFNYSEMVIPVIHPSGTAIVLAGGGESNNLFPATQFLSDRAVRVFRRRNIHDEQDDSELDRIWYLHPDLIHDIPGADGNDFDGYPAPDVDSVADLASLEHAITVWAPSLVSMRDDQGFLSADAVLDTPLVLYLIGDFLLNDDEPDELFINEVETISPSELVILLDEFEEAVKSEYVSSGATPPDYVPVTIVIEGPSSGSFIEPLSRQGRVILTSTEENGPSYMLSDGSVSFSGYFLNRIASGHYIHPSFAYAQLNILTNPTFSGQRPQIEATGNGTPNEIADGIATASMAMEFRPFANTRPLIQNGLGQMTLRDNPSYLLWVYVDDPENGVDSVEALVTPPVGSYEETRVFQLQEHAAITNRWEGIADRFLGQGEYTISYLATDDAGNAAFPVTRTVFFQDTVPPLDVTNLRPTGFCFNCGDQRAIQWNSSESGDTQGYRAYVTPPSCPPDMDPVECLDGSWPLPFDVDMGNVHWHRIENIPWTSYPGLFHVCVVAYDRVPLESACETAAFGADVAERPIDSTTGEAPVTVTYGQVLNEGSTSLTTAATGPFPLPAGFSIGNPPTYFDIQSTFIFSGAEVCIDFSNMAFEDDSTVRLYHYEDSTWVDRTVSLDTTNHIVCASVDTLSPFVLVEPENHPPDGADDSYPATEDNVLNVLAPGILMNDSDPNGDVIQVDSFTQPGFGSLVQHVDGSFSYGPDANYCGTDTYEYTVSDGNGGTDTATVAIEIECINDPPIADAGPDIQLTANDACEAVADLDGGNSSDLEDDPLAFEWTHGLVIKTGVVVTFDVSFGTNTITLEVNDGMGGLDLDDVFVTVLDATAPTIVLTGEEMMVVECTGGFADPGATASDNCDSDVGVAIGGDSVDPMVLGSYLLTYDASDASGNAADQVTRNVLVEDSVPPMMSAVSANPAVLWPPNHKMRSVEVEVMASDACDSQPPTCSITSITSNEPETGCGSGQTKPDWNIIGELSAELRAECCGSGNDRVYTISVSCADETGNVFGGSVMVTVPHDQGG